jgi:hypothetical protein
MMTKKMMLRISDTIATSFAGLDDVVIYSIPKVLYRTPKHKGHIDIIIAGYLQAGFYVI